MFRLLLALAMLIHLASYAQVDSKKIDSLRRAVDSQQKAFRAYQDSFNKIQDSVYRAQTKKDIEQMANNTVRFVQNRDREEKRKAMRYIFIGVGFLVLLIVGLMRKRKKVDKL